MAVRVIMSGNTLQFHPDSGADNDVADYLCKLVNDAKALGKSRAGVVAKARLGETVLKVREAQAEKLQLLKAVADKADEKSRDWSLAPEIRGIAKAKADAAREEARKIATELGL